MSPGSESGPTLVGLTGGLASGKSTVARMLAEEGFRVVDADGLVAELYRPGQPGAEVVRGLFGDEVLDDTGGVDHPALARRAFGDPQARRRLEEAIHPLVRKRFAQLAAEAEEDVVVLEATLLVEAGFAPDFDRVVTVEAPAPVRLARAVERGLERADARARLAAQGEGETRRAAAHHVLHNEADLDTLRCRVAALAEEIRSTADAGPA